MKSSAELLRGLKKEVWGMVGILVLAEILQKFGFANIPDMLLGAIGAMFVLGFWLIQCTEIIIAAIKEGKRFP